jgi:hypothetical protein
MKAYGGSGQLHAAATSPPPPISIHWIGGWADPSVGLDDVEKILDRTRTPCSLPVLVWGAVLSAHLGLVG